MFKLAPVIIILLIPGLVIGQPSFQKEALSASPAIEQNALLEWTDVEGDGDMDFLAFYPNPTVAGAYKVRLYENNNQVFQGIDNPISGGTNISASAFFIADGDQDNDSDILFIEDRKIKIVRNNGDKSFSVLETGVLVTWDGAHLYWVDMDGDMDLDIITEFTSNNFSLVWNRDGVYGGRFDYPTEINSMSFADTDNNGFLDFFASLDGGLGGVALVDEVSGPVLILPMGSNCPDFPKTLWTDIDNDRDADLFRLENDGRWRLYKNNHSERITDPYFDGPPFWGVFQSAALSSPAADVGDINSDGLPDLIVSGNQKTLLYLNRSAGGVIRFDELDLQIPPSDRTAIRMIDIDHQNGLDFLFSTENSAGTSIEYSLYINTLANPVPPPAAPTGLTEVVESFGRLHLSWVDASHGNSYRLELSKDGVAVTATESKSDGTLMRISRASEIFETSLQLFRLPAGNYSWRVQAIDASQQGSAFSETRLIQIPESSRAQFEHYPIEITPAVEPKSKLEWLDVEGDGDMDILSFYPDPVIAGTYKVRLYENNNLVFRGIENPFSGGLNIQAKAFAVADGNQDNRIDFVFIENQTIKFAKNNGDKTFTIQDTGVSVAPDEAHIHLFDMDADGDQDIVTSYHVILSHLIGGGGDVAYPADFEFMSFADVNNDGLMDFFVVMYDPNYGHRGYLAKSGSLTKGVISLISGSLYNPDPKILWTDVDNDGDIDLFALTTAGWTVFKNLFLETGFPTFEPAYSSFESTSPIAEIGDVNSDGLPDISIQGTNYINHSTATSIQFVISYSWVYFLADTKFMLLDIDNQKGLDFVIYDSRGTVAYLNTQSNLPAPPQTPTSLLSDITVEGLKLSWASSGPGINYRVEIFKDGKLFISSSSRSDGKLLRQQRSPVLLSNSIVYRNLPGGIYTWRVQAIDASFRASAFSDIKQTAVVPDPIDPNNPVTGWEEQSPTGLLQIYPNPAVNNLFINIPASGRLIIRNALSYLMFTAECEHSPEGPGVRVSTEGWSEGMYFIEFSDGKKRWTEKVMVLR